MRGGISETYVWAGDKKKTKKKWSCSREFENWENTPEHNKNKETQKRHLSMMKNILEGKMEKKGGGGGGGGGLKITR